MIYATMGAMLGVIVSLLGFVVVIHARHNQLIEQMGIRAFEKELAWKEERQQLLDRIQANSFAEYKTAEVRVIKAQKEDKPEQLPQMV